jgi:hypothetical protein
MERRAVSARGKADGGVRVIDPDTVSEANIGRQMFSPSDVGLPKATVLVHRINMFFGLDWAAHRATYQNVGHPGDIVIGCVDTAAARRSIATAVKGRWDGYWLDLGNEESTGQVVLGRWVKRLDKKDEDLRDSAARLPRRFVLAAAHGNHGQTGLRPELTAEGPVADVGDGVIGEVPGARLHGEDDAVEGFGHALAVIAVGPEFGDLHGGVQGFGIRAGQCAKAVFAKVVAEPGENRSAGWFGCGHGVLRWSVSGSEGEQHGQRARRAAGNAEGEACGAQQAGK